MNNYKYYLAKFNFFSHSADLTGLKLMITKIYKPPGSGFKGVPCWRGGRLFIPGCSARK